MVEENRKEDRKIEKLYTLFTYGYKPKDISEILNIPLNVIDEAYKKWINLKKEMEGRCKR